jgi:hypothetical protein
MKPLFTDALLGEGVRYETAGSISNANLSTTADIYTHIQTQSKKRLTGYMGDILSGIC